MPSERDRRWLRDILANIAVVESVTARIDSDRFARDTVLRYAVIYALLSISEAARRLSADFKRKQQVFDWRDVEHAGNVYRHEYHRLDVDLMWNTAVAELPALKAAVQIALKET